MTHEETSFQTKMMLCNSLKSIMKQKPFSKITVSEYLWTVKMDAGTGSIRGCTAVRPTGRL